MTNQRDEIRRLKAKVAALQETVREAYDIFKFIDPGLFLWSAWASRPEVKEAIAQHKKVKF